MNQSLNSQHAAEERADRAAREWQEAVAKSNAFAAQAKAEAMAKYAASQGGHSQAAQPILAPIGQISSNGPFEGGRWFPLPGPQGASAAHRHSAAIVALEEQAGKFSRQACEMLAAANFLRKLP